MLPIGIVPAVGDERSPTAWVWKFHDPEKKLPPIVMLTVSGLLPLTTGEVVGLGAVNWMAPGFTVTLAEVAIGCIGACPGARTACFLAVRCPYRGAASKSTISPSALLMHLD